MNVVFTDGVARVIPSNGDEVDELYEMEGTYPHADLVWEVREDTFAPHLTIFLEQFAEEEFEENVPQVVIDACS